MPSPALSSPAPLAESASAGSSPWAQSEMIQTHDQITVSKIGSPIVAPSKTEYVDDNDQYSPQNNYIEQISKNIIVSPGESNLSPLDKKHRLFAKGKGLVPSSLDINVMDFAQFTDSALLILGENNGPVPFIYLMPSRSVLPIKFNVDIEKIESIEHKNGRKLFGLSAGTMYEYDMLHEKDSYPHLLEWRPIVQPFTEITHMSVSDTGDVVWVQSRTAGVNMLEQNDTVPVIEGSLRFYGKNKDDFVTIRRNTVNINSREVKEDVYVPCYTTLGWHFVSRDDHVDNGVMTIKKVCDVDVTRRFS